MCVIILMFSCIKYFLWRIVSSHSSQYRIFVTNRTNRLKWMTRLNRSICAQMVRDRSATVTEWQKISQKHSEVKSIFFFKIHNFGMWFIISKLRNSSSGMCIALKRDFCFTPNKILSCRWFPSRWASWRWCAQTTRKITTIITPTIICIIITGRQSWCSIGCCLSGSCSKCFSNRWHGS